jgi:hypothetical protein
MSPGWDLTAGAPAAEAAATPPPSGRASWWRTLGQGVLLALVLGSAQFALALLALLAGAGPGAVVGRILPYAQAWPPFTDAPLANGAAGVLAALAVAGALRLTVRSRQGLPPAFAWTLVGAAAGVAVGSAGTGHLGWALVIALVIVRQCGYRLDGTPAATLPWGRGGRIAVAAVAVAAAAVVLGRCWTDPIAFANGSSEPALSRVPAHELAPADRARAVHVLGLLVENAGPRTVAVISARFVGPGAAAAAPRLIGLRSTQTGTYTSDQPYYLPYRPVRIAPGEDGELDLLVTGGCGGLGPLTLRLAHSAGHSDLRLDHALPGRCRHA